MSHLQTMVGRLHVAATDYEVIRYMRSRVAKKHRTTREKRKERHKMYRLALKYHHENQKLYYRIARGIY